MILGYETLLQLLIAVFVGGIVGVEREWCHKPAGIRTHMLVCLGSCLFTLASISFSGADPSRVAASIVTGIGFIGAGAIIAEKEKVVGITTAASLWTTSSLGLLVGLGEAPLALVASILVLFILLLEQFILRVEHKPV